ncbi:MAG TPA: PQQ-dependent sugar dehydrogenase [Mycobacteriales bacterium]|nr:PQQ-dependent sugar dehydrogenase [Mycobacteriales bacterium]
MRARLVALALAAVLAACSADDPAPKAVPTTTTAAPSVTTTATATPTAVPTVHTSPSPARITVATITSGLEVPWGLAFLPDGSALVSERDTARIHRVTAAGSHSVVAAVPGVVPQGEGGLLGLAVSPSYASDHWVYAYYSAASDNRVVRLRLSAPAQQQVLLSGIPVAGNHNGGRLAFGPDGMLYAGTGDAGEPDRAQSTTSLGGKVLRIKPTGGAAAGNPFGNAVWSMGHRNVQGLAFDPAGRLWATEFGQSTWDEVNLIVKGKNYGWPVVEGKGTGGGAYVSPKVVWSTSEASPSGVAYGGGELHVAALRGTRLWDVPLSGTSTGTPAARYVGTYGRIRTAVLEPGGQALWLATSNCDGRGSCGSSKDQVIRVPL